jgi:hypothetical protein
MFAICIHRVLTPARWPHPIDGEFLHSNSLLAINADDSLFPDVTACKYRHKRSLLATGVEC